MSNDAKEKTGVEATKPRPANKDNQSESRKKRLAEQLRINLRNRKAQTRLRRNFDKSSDN
jgi:hypothetical protein